MFVSSNVSSITDQLQRMFTN